MGKASKTLAGLALAAPLALAATAAHTAPLETALGVVIDGSGSINSGEFTTQIDAYEAVFGNSSIVPANGSVAVNVAQFSNSAQLERTAIRINNETDRTTLLNAFSAITQIGSTTCIECGIDVAVNDMDIFLGNVTDLAPDFRKLVDVSTDGQETTGDANQGVADAVSSGYDQVNCLGIGAGADCSWNRDAEDLDFVATSFADVENALEDKVGTELGTVPLPGILPLFAIGLVGLGYARRRAA